jgi:hypothetical protein
VGKWTQDQTLQWYINGIDVMTHRLGNLNAELDFALFSLEFRLPLRVAKRPDMHLGDVTVNIKNLS